MFICNSDKEYFGLGLELIHVPLLFCFFISQAQHALPC